MPHVGDLEARDQRERFGPVGARVAGDRGLGVASGAVLHVARLGRPAAVQAGAITPFAIELNPVRRVRNEQPRLALTQEPRDGLRAGGVPTKHAVRTTKPQVSRPQTATSGSQISGAESSGRPAKEMRALFATSTGCRMSRLTQSLQRKPFHGWKP